MPNFLLREWSDTKLTFTLFQTECWKTTTVDANDYDSFQLNLSFSDWTSAELNWTINSDWTVQFILPSSITKGKSWWAKMEIWWFEWWSQIRFNENAIKCTVSQSLNVPE